MAWNFGLYAPYIAASATLIKVSEGWQTFNGAPAQVWIRGSGFTYGANGQLKGGTITSMELVDVSGPPAAMQTVTMPAGTTAAALVAHLAAAKGLHDQFQSWHVEIADGHPTAAGAELACVDGTTLSIAISNWNPDTNTGKVTSIRHLAADGTTVLDRAAGLPLPVFTVRTALGGDFTLYELLTAGDNTVVGNGMAGWLEGGAGNDTITFVAEQGFPAGNVDYEAALSAVVVDLDDGTGNERGIATGGGGRDTLFGIDGASGSSFGDKLTGNAHSNQLSGNAGNDTLRGEAGFDHLYGGAGNDSIDGGTDDDWLSGGAGNDTLLGGQGNDTADFHEDALDDLPTSGIKVSLAKLGAQLIGGGHGTDTLVGIENVSGSKFADEITGNGDRNRLEGRGGADRLDGGAGSDTLDGGSGNDTYIVDSAQDAVVEEALGGTDTVRTSTTVYLLGQNVENLVWTGTGSFTGSGNIGNNSITGGAGIDQLTGQDGNDTIRGGAGNDVIIGDNWAMTGPLAAVAPVVNAMGITMGSGHVVKLDTANIGSTARALDVSHKFSLAADPDIGDATTVPHVSIEATGGGRIDYYRVDLAHAGATIVADIDHGFGQNSPGGHATMLTIYDSAGHFLARTNDGDPDSGAGGSSDNMDSFLSHTVGSAGTYYVAVSKMPYDGVYQEQPVPAGATYTLQISVANEIVGNNDVLYGDDGNDLVFGNQGNDTLVGGSGNDTLDGGSGSDSMAGGLGNDVYRIDDARDVVTELADQGTDTIESSNSTILGANFENLTLIGAANINGTGNARANDITDNAGNNVVNGGLGADIIRLGAGKDTVMFTTDLSADNIDLVVGYSVADDTINLRRAIFAEAGPNGWLSAEAFHNGAAAHDASDRIIYNSPTGALYYDADGSGAVAQVQFATLSAGLNLVRMDFWIG